MEIVRTALSHPLTFIVMAMFILIWGVLKANHYKELALFRFFCDQMLTYPLQRLK